MLITSASSASSATGNGSGHGESPAGEDYFVQLLSFDKSGESSGTVDFGSWTTRSHDQAVERLRLYVSWARRHMSECAKPSATRWIRSDRVARQVCETLVGGAMYVYVIADGLVFYEISARPVVLPIADEDRIGSWTPDETVHFPAVAGRWSR